MLEYKFDTQLLIDGKDLSENAINEYITQHIKGDCLLAVGDETLIKIHYHTNDLGRSWNTALPSAKSTMLSWKIWSAKKTVCPADFICLGKYTFLYRPTLSVNWII